MIEWDETKRQATLQARGLDFAAVVRFEDATALFRQDTRRAYGEVRTQGLGMLDGQLVMLVFTLRGQDLRVISLRKANGKEAKRYDAYRKAQSP